MEIERILKQYKKNYSRIFESIYPSKNSTGFTERNLSVNFAKAYEQMYPQAFTWYEFQFGQNNNLHYDAIIINPQKKELIIIESKRFDKLPKKVNEVYEDINRINSFRTSYFAEFAERIPSLANYAIKGVILADVWTETESKTKINESFQNRTFIENYFPDLYKIQASWFFNGYYFNLDFSTIKSSPVRDNRYIRDTYHLLGIVWDVNKE